MNTKSVFYLAGALCLGIAIGWFSRAFLESRAGAAQSLLELSQALDGSRADPQRTVLHATRAVVLNPNAYLGFLSLAEAYERIGHRDLALESYEEALRLSRLEGGKQEQVNLEKKIQQLKSTGAKK